MFEKIKEYLKSFRTPKYQYTFLCRNCDILYDRYKYKPDCPMCGRPGETYNLKSLKED